MIKITIQGVKEIRRILGKVVRTIYYTTDQKIDQAGRLAARSVKEQMYGSRTRAIRAGKRPGIYGRDPTKKRTSGAARKRGKVGRRPGLPKKKSSNKWGKFKAPLPDHVLAIDSGHLRKSIGARSAASEGVWEKTFKQSSFIRTVTLKVGTKVKYAMIHEFGGPAIAFGKWKFQMPKRPFFAPGVVKARPLIEAMFFNKIRISF